MIKVVTWRNGNAKNATCYGIRVYKENYKVLEDWQEILLEDLIIYRKKSKFSLKCPEIRNKHFKAFFDKNGLLDWQDRKPNILYLMELEENKYRLLLETI